MMIQKYYRTQENATHEVKYSMVASNQYLCRGSMENHDAKKHDSGNSCGMSLKKSWIISRWAIESFFSFSACAWFPNSDMKLLQHRKELANILLIDSFDKIVVGEKCSRVAWKSALFCTLMNLLLLKKFVDRNWKNNFKKPYKQLTSSIPGCKKIVLTVYTFARGVNRWRGCSTKHDQEVTKLNPMEG